MGLFTSSPQLDSLECLLIDQLQDLYDAEQRLVKALPLMAQAATNTSLKNGFQEHLRETQNQVTRLEQCFKAMGQSAKSKTCEAMKGLITEGQEMINAKGNNDVRDAALIAAAQRVEHYEIAAYGSARTFARRCGKHEVASLLQQTLNEEKNADQLLNDIAEQSVNTKAQSAQMASR